MPFSIRASCSLIIGIAAAILMMSSKVSAAHAEPPIGTDRVGTSALVTRDVEASWKSDDRSTGSSSDRDTLVERVIGSYGDGLEIEYDLPGSATEEDRALNWQFPVRVFRPTSGRMQLLNGPELAVRLDAWLENAKLPRAVCGHSYVTWYTFKVECDPQAIVRVVEKYDLRFDDLHDGCSYTDSQASKPTTLRKTAIGSSGYRFTGTMPVDPDQVRQEQAHSDIVAAEVANKTLTLSEAMRSRSTEKVAGTIEIAFDTDAEGVVQWRTKRTSLETVMDGVKEDRTIVEVVERRGGGSGSLKLSR